MKRYIYIIIGIIAAAGIAILILFLIKNNSASTALNAFTPSGSLPATGTQGGNASSSAGTPVETLGLSPVATGTPAVSGQVSVQKFGVLSDAPVLDYFIDAQNNITAIEPSGEVVTIANGQTTTVNSSTIDNIISASFSYDGKKIVMNYGDVTNPQTAVFTVASNVWVALPKGMQSPQWSPINNYQIAYLAPTASGKLALSTIDATNIKNGPTVLFSLSANDLTLQWISKSEFILSDKPTSENEGSVWALNTTAGTMTPLLYEVSGAEGIWSHNTTIPYGLAFFNKTSGQGNTLQLQPFTGSLPTQPLNFLTLPSKCAFNTEQMPITPSSTATSAAATTTASTTVKSKTKTTITPAATSTPYLALYCGIPRDTAAFSAAAVPDDYNQMALFTSDNIDRINTQTGEIDALWNDPAQNVDVSNIKTFGNEVFFVDRYTNKLFALTLQN